MGHEPRFRAILIVDFDLTVAKIFVQCYKKFRVSHGFDAFFHAGYWIRFAYSNNIDISITDEKA